MGSKGIVLVEPNPTGQFSNKTEINAYKPALNVDSAFKGDLDKISLEQSQASLQEAMAGIENVGRPVYGIMAKPNTHAYVQVIGPNGNTIKCFNNVGIPMNHNQFGYYLTDGLKKKDEKGYFDSVADTFNSKVKAFADAFRTQKGEQRKLVPGKPGENKSAVWTDWILQSVQESRVEKTQVVETFGDSYFYAFGQKPRSIAFSGLLMNTVDYNWRSIFWKNWDEYFRATKLVERGARVYIQWDEIIVEGYPINAICSEVADSPNAMKFSFTLFVTRYVNLSAQSGFLTQQYMKIAQLKAGSGIGMISKEQGYRLLGGEAFAGDRVKFEKFSLLGQLGPNLGNTAKSFLLKTEFMRDAQSTATGRSLLRQAGYLTNFLYKSARSLGSNPRFNDAQRKTMNSAFLQQAYNDMSAAIATDAANAVEDTLQVRRGEINQIMASFTDLLEGPKNRTREGKKFSLSPYAKYSSVQRLAQSWVNPGTWGGSYVDSQGIRRSWGERAGGVVLVDDGGTPVGRVIEDFAVAERDSVARSESFSVGEREAVEDILDV